MAVGEGSGRGGGISWNDQVIDWILRHLMLWINASLNPRFNPLAKMLGILFHLILGKKDVIHSIATIILKN